MKKVLCLVMLVTLVVWAAAGNDFHNGSGDGRWDNPANWSSGVVPQDATTNPGTATPPWNNDVAIPCGETAVIDAGTNATAYGLMMGQYGCVSGVNMTGGSLTVGDWGLNIGRGGNGNAGHAGSFGTFQMSGGVLNAEYINLPQMWGTDPIITGHWIMDGGIANANWLRLGGDNGPGVGTLDLNGGVINLSSSLTINGVDSLIDVAGGTLIINGNHESTIQGYIDIGWITAFDGDGFFQLDYNTRNAGKTTLTAGHVNQASNPDPDDRDAGIFINPVLSWSAGVGAESHDVYFGTTELPSFIGNQGLANTTYSPGTLSYDTTYFWRIDEVQGGNAFTGTTWTFTTGSPPAAAQSPEPANGSTDMKPSTKLRWTPSADADSHDVYFGTTNPPSFVSNEDNALYDPGALDPDTTYYWRIDEKNINGTTTGTVWDFTISALPAGDLNSDWLVNLADLNLFASRWLDQSCSYPDWCQGADLSQSSNVDLVDYAMWAPEYSNIQPPYTDYCDMLSQEIQGKKHGFMAGNLTYYTGGFHGVWDFWESETIGLTHPFHHDLRSRGTGMVQSETTGYGHDFSGWEFHRFTKVAYGSVWIGGTKYTNPVPTAMYWQPDKMICEYSVGGVNIHEEKFIADNDVVCTIITSDSPVTLEFAGQSFALDGKSVTRAATCELDVANNSVHVVEGGTIQVNPDDNGFETGVLMYDGMSTVLSASRTLTDYSQSEITSGQWAYSFRVPCDSSGVSLVWAMDDEYSTAVTNIQEVLADPSGKMQAKTDHMNDILNYQIPYFRCSDQDIVNIYYYLWSLQMMYMIDVDQGFEQYPHTQTAVNNFLGMHRWDAHFQIQAGAWAADKEKYANGNVLIWSELLPFANLQDGIIPADNMGIAWYSGLWGSVTGHVGGAWKIYEHSGDLGFLREAYDFYKALMWQRIPGDWGAQYDAADRLAKMAYELGCPEDMQHWYDLVNMDNIDNWLNARWETVEPHWFLGGDPLDWSSMACMAMDAFPDDWAWEMTEYWATNEVDGFFRFGHISTLAYKDWDQQHHAFAFTPDTNWSAIRGMYEHHVGSNANKCTLGHLKNYHLEWGIPIAPEALDINGDPWGDQYSNFNAGKILLILEGILGLKYSVVDESFTVSDHLPDEWDYMETYVPITENGNTQWTQVHVSRVEDATTVEKTISVKGNTQSTLNVQPWLEEKNLLTAPAGYTDQLPKGHIGYEFDDAKETTIQIVLEK